MRSKEHSILTTYVNIRFRYLSEIIRKEWQLIAIFILIIWVQNKDLKKAIFAQSADWQLAIRIAFPLMLWGLFSNVFRQRRLYIKALFKSGWCSPLPFDLSTSRNFRRILILETIFLPLIIGTIAWAWLEFRVFGGDQKKAVFLWLLAIFFASIFSLLRMPDKLQYKTFQSKIFKLEHRYRRINPLSSGCTQLFLNKKPWIIGSPILLVLLDIATIGDPVSKPFQRILVYSIGALVLMAYLKEIRPLDAMIRILPKHKWQLLYELSLPMICLHGILLGFTFLLWQESFQSMHLPSLELSNLLLICLGCTLASNALLSKEYKNLIILVSGIIMGLLLYRESWSSLYAGWATIIIIIPGFLYYEKMKVSL